jgi:hypothetical protein
VVAAFLERSRSFEVYSLALLSKPKFWCDEAEVRFVSKRQNVSVVIEDSRVTRLFIGNSLSTAVADRINSLAAAIDVVFLRPGVVACQPSLGGARPCV